MITWDDGLTIMAKGAKVSASDSDSMTYLKMMANIGYKAILSDFGRPNIERTKTALTVANQQAYQLPGDVLFPKTITVTVGGTIYTANEVSGQEQWDRLNNIVQASDIVEWFFMRPNFGVGGTELLLWPTPSSAGRTITMVYEATDKDISQTAYTAGSIAVTSGSATVTGTGTLFTLSMVGRYLKITDTAADGLWYRVAARPSSTQITLENVYEGNTGSGLSYQISEAFGIPEDMQILPFYYALMHWYMTKENAAALKQYFALFDGGLKAAKDRYGTRTRKDTVYMDVNMAIGGYPSYFPTLAS